mmetsp:Transcript_15687/g.36796  ORF Transcript_15687/g.36796 Transcript_15687/m.36796 type:complete len:925 (+) Transcript_15687:128-2902(+)
MQNDLRAALLPLPNLEQTRRLSFENPVTPPRRSFDSPTHEELASTSSTLPSSARCERIQTLTWDEGTYKSHSARERERQRRAKSQSPHHKRFANNPGDWSTSMPLERRKTLPKQKFRPMFSPVGGAAGEAYTFPHDMQCFNCGGGLKDKEARWGTGLCDRCWETSRKTCSICKENLYKKHLQWGSGLCRDCFNNAQKDCVLCGVKLGEDQMKWQTGMCDHCYDRYDKTCTFCTKILDFKQVRWRTGLCDTCYDTCPKTCARCAQKLDRKYEQWKSGLCKPCHDECDQQCRDCKADIPLGSLHWATSLCDTCYDKYDKQCRGHNCRQWLEPSMRIQNGGGVCDTCKDKYTSSCQMCKLLFLPNQVHWDTGLCDKCYDKCIKVCKKCQKNIPFGQLKWCSGLCDECYMKCETCQLCHKRIELQQIVQWGTRLCNECFDSLDVPEKLCRGCSKALELGELYWGTGRCDSCYNVHQGVKPDQPFKAGVSAAIWAQLVFYMAPGVLQPSLYLKLQALPGVYNRAARAYSWVLATASIAAMVAPIPLGLWASKRGEREVYVGVCLLGALAAFVLALPVNVPVFALAWALLTFPPAVRGVRATYFAKNVNPKELSRAGQLASSAGLIGGFLGPVTSTLSAWVFGEPSEDSDMDGFVFGSLLSGILFLAFALVLAVTFEVPRHRLPRQPETSSQDGTNSEELDYSEFCDHCATALSDRERKWGTALCDSCFDNFAGSNVSFGKYWKTILIVFCVIAALLEVSMNAGVIATFQPIVVEHFHWGNNQIAAVNVLGTGLSMGVSLGMAQMRLPEKEQAAGAAVLYLLGVTFFTAPPLQEWRLVVGIMLGVKAQILFMAPFTAVFSNLIGGARVTNFLTTALCLAPACGAALGTILAPYLVEEAGTPMFFSAALPAILALVIIVLGWTHVRPRQRT